MVKNPSATAGDVREPGSVSGWENPLEKEMQYTPVFSPMDRGVTGGQSMGLQRVGHN